MEFGRVLLWVLILEIVGTFAFSVFFPPIEGACFALALNILLFPPFLSAGVRRLHDMDRSGYWIAFLPTLTVFLLLWLLLARGTVRENRFDQKKDSFARRLGKVTGLCIVFSSVLWIVSAQIPTFIPAEVTKETHGLTEPRFPDGSVDYGTAVMMRHAECFEDPEQNGFRILAEEFGPAVFCELCTYADLPKDPGREWIWLKTCEKLGLDPNLKPNWPEADLDRTVELCREARKRKLLEKSAAACLKEIQNAALEKNAEKEKEEKPEKNGESEKNGETENAPDPDAAKMIAEQEEALRRFQTLDPLLDRIVEAAEKPYLMPWCVMEEQNSPTYTAALCAEHRTMAHALALRANLRLEADETGSVLRDLRALLRLGMHAGKRGDAVSVLMQYRIEQIAYGVFWKVLLSENVTSAQLEQFRETFRELSERRTFQEVCEMEILDAYRLFQWFKSEYLASVVLKSSESGNEVRSWRAQLRDHFRWWKSEMDENAARKVLCEHLEILQHASLESDPILRRQKLEEAGEVFDADMETAAWRLTYGFLSAKVRAECLTRIFVNLTCPVYAMIDDGMNAGNARFRMAQIALEAEIFHRKNGKYPETLEELELSEELLTDPFTGRKTFEYRLNTETQESWQKRFDAWLVRQYRSADRHHIALNTEFQQHGTVSAEELSEYWDTLEHSELAEEELLQDEEFEDGANWLRRPFFLYCAENLKRDERRRSRPVPRMLVLKQSHDRTSVEDQRAARSPEDRVDEKRPILKS